MAGERSGAGLTVVVADDDSFTRSLVADGLRGEGFEVRVAADPAAAWALLEGDDVHALVTDLDFGSGRSGASLLRQVAAERPWVALVVLTSHVSPELAVRDSESLPPGLSYLVKSRLRHIGDISAAVHDALAGRRAAEPPAGDRDEDVDAPVAITASQADVLRMLAGGMSTRDIADERGTSVRAAETMIARLYAALGLSETTSTPPDRRAAPLATGPRPGSLNGWFGDANIAATSRLRRRVAAGMLGPGERATIGGSELSDIEHEPTGLAGLRVLVVDDEDQIVELLSLVIRTSGGVARGAATADQAIAKLTTDAVVDVVVTDLVMPGTTGRGLLDWLAVEHPHVPVVAMSGIPEQNDSAARRSNVRAVLDKPFTPAELVAAIRLAVRAGSPA